MLSAEQPRTRRIDTVAYRTAWAACLALPLALLHARAVAEMLIAVIDLGFLLHVGITRDVALRHPFTWAAGAWWLWLVVCSAIGANGLALALALAAVRLPLLAIAVGEWLLTGHNAQSRQRALWLVLAACLAWIGLECWDQYLTGHNLFGQTRWPDGALTGPFNKPRAGPAFILLLFPVVIPMAVSVVVPVAVPARLALPVAAPVFRKAVRLALLPAAGLTLLLIGQRMPSVLMVLGFALVAVLLPRLRPAIAATAGVGALLLMLLPVLSPAAYGKLVVHFADQMRHFGDSDYGITFVRGYTVARLRPWSGFGFDGFRRGCGIIWAMHGIEWLGIPTYQLNGGMRACNLHPHNYYLEAADDAGVPGVLLFAGLAATALIRLGHGVWRRPDPLRVGLLAGAVVALWPVASTSAFTSMPNGGWVFLLLGLGFAAAGTQPGPLRSKQAAGGTTRHER